MPFGRAAWTRRREASRDNLSVSVDDWKQARLHSAADNDIPARVHNSSKNDTDQLRPSAEPDGIEPLVLNTATPTASHHSLGVCTAFTAR